MRKDEKSDVRAALSHDNDLLLVLGVMQELTRRVGKTLPEQDILEMLKALEISSQRGIKALREASRKGFIHQPQKGFLQII